MRWLTMTQFLWGHYICFQIRTCNDFHPQKPECITGIGIQDILLPKDSFMVGECNIITYFYTVAACPI